jgi:tetratricopeptide (TPR) repeat protein
MYPHDWRPWLNIANLDNQLGNYPQAIDAGKQAVQLNPNARDYAVAVRAYKNASRFAEAKALMNEAERRGLRRGGNSNFEIAFYEHDKATFDREVKDEEDSQWQLRNYYLGQARSMEGKYAETKQLMQAEMDEDRRLNKGEIADGVLVELALIAREYGYPAEARAALARISKGYLDGNDVAYEFAMNGDITFARRYVAVHEHDPHAPTDQAVIVMPRLRSAVAMQEGRLAEALAALEPARPYELASFVTLTNRAAIYMKMGEPGKAVEDYKKILANPGAGFGVLYPMARLGLARAEAAAGDFPASREAYQGFLSEWKNADADLPVLKAAKAELAKIEH